MPTRWFPSWRRGRSWRPNGDRSKVIIEPMLTDQWFVKAEAIVGPAIEGSAVGRDQDPPRTA